MEPFYDFDLDRRLQEVADAWEIRANEELAAHPRLAEVREEIDVGVPIHNFVVQLLNEAIADGERTLADVMERLPDLPGRNRSTHWRH